MIDCRTKVDLFFIKRVLTYSRSLSCYNVNILLWRLVPFSQKKLKIQVIKTKLSKNRSRKSGFKSTRGKLLQCFLWIVYTANIDLIFIKSSLALSSCQLLPLLLYKYFNSNFIAHRFPRKEVSRLVACVLCSLIILLALRWDFEISRSVVSCL